MSKQVFWSLLAMLLFSNAFLVFNSSSASNLANSSSVQQGNLGVLNLNTGKSYATIQEAIDALETLDGHRISVASGVYHESLTVNKSVTLVGETRDSTVIDGNGASSVIYVTADNVEIRSFTIQNGTFGLWLHNSDNSRIIDNTLQDGSYGIRLLKCRNSVVAGNIVRRYTFFGLELDSSGNSTLQNNSLEGNKYNLGVDGKSLFDFTNNIDTSNTVNGKPVRYLSNQHDLTISGSSFSEIGYLGIVNSTNIKVEDLTVHDNVQGVLFAFTKDSTITDVNAQNNWNGIFVTYSSNVSVKENKANQNFDYGIKFFGSPHSEAMRNNVDNNGWAGIGVFGSPNSTVEENEASYNTYNLHLVYTNNSVIAKNTSFKKAGGYSIAVYYSHNNFIYHNTLENALLFAETRNGTRFIPPNRWDNGLEGNYWTNYEGADADFDGVGDTPRRVGENNTDNYPLMGKFTEATLNVEDKTYSIAVISNSTISEPQYNPDKNSISLSAFGENGTQGFMRVAIPNNFFQDMQEESVSFLVNGEQPVVKNHWADDAHIYFYLVYTNVTPEQPVSPWLFLALFVVTFLLVLVLVFLILKRKR